MKPVPVPGIWDVSGNGRLVPGNKIAREWLSRRPDRKSREGELVLRENELITLFDREKEKNQMKLEGLNGNN